MRYTQPAIIFVLVPALLFLASATAAENVLLSGARVYDGQGGPALPSADILIVDGVIENISDHGRLTPPDDTTVIDYAGKTIIPGLISAHAHVGQYVGTASSVAAYNRHNIDFQLRNFRVYGVTTIAALGLNRPLIYELLGPKNEQPLGGADLLVADRGIGAAGGVPAADAVRIAPDQLDRPDTVEAARTAVRDAKKRGTHLIKIWLDTAGGTLPRMRDEIFTAVIDEAHKNDLRVASHVYALNDAKAVVAAGVDIIAHGVRDQPVDDELIEMLKKRKVYYIPTIALDEASYIYADAPAWMQEPFFQEAVQPELRKQFNDPAWRKRILESPQTEQSRRNVTMNQRNVLQLHKAGVTIAFGTDAGAFPHRIPGFAEHREILLLAQAGIPFSEILVIATKNSAAALGLSDRGVIAPGKRADLVVLNGDPASDIAAFQDIKAVWQKDRHVIDHDAATPVPELPKTIQRAKQLN